MYRQEVYSVGTGLKIVAQTVTNLLSHKRLGRPWARGLTRISASLRLRAATLREESVRHGTAPRVQRSNQTHWDKQSIQTASGEKAARNHFNQNCLGLYIAAVMLSQLRCAISAWGSFLDCERISKIDAFLFRAFRCGLYRGAYVYRVARFTDTSLTNSVLFCLYF